MRWQDRLTDPDLLEGNLNIVGDPTKRAESTFTAESLTELVDAVRNGVHCLGDVYPVKTLTISQFYFPKSRAVFSTFINALFQIPTLTDFDLGVDSSSSHVLSEEQTALLANAVSTSPHLKALRVKVSDTRENAAILASMLARNTALQQFWCDITDDAYDYPVIKAAATENSTLRLLMLPYTAINTWAGFPVKQADNRNANTSLKIVAEDGETFKIPSTPVSASCHRFK